MCLKKYIKNYVITRQKNEVEAHNKHVLESKGENIRHLFLTI